MTTCPVCGHRHACEPHETAGPQAGPHGVFEDQIVDHGGGRAPHAADEAASAAIVVEANVLAACNGAYDRAEQARSEEVYLAHLLFVLADTASLEAWLVAYDIDRDLLRIELEPLEAALPSNGTALDPPTTSAAMRSVLRAADTGARRRSAHVGIGDVLLALMVATDDAAGQLLAEHIARQRQRRRRGLRPSAGGPQAGTGMLGLSDPFPPFAPPLYEMKTPSEANDANGADVSVFRSSVASTGRAHEHWLSSPANGGDPSWNADTAGSDVPAGRDGGGMDDLYRPGESEPSNGWYRAPAWLASQGRVAPAVPETGQSSESPTSDATLREMLRHLAEVRTQIAARLDEQDTQLEDIAERLDELTESWEAPTSVAGAEAAVPTAALRVAQAIAAADVDDQAVAGHALATGVLGGRVDRMSVLRPGETANGAGNNGSGAAIQATAGKANASSAGKGAGNGSGASTGAGKSSRHLYLERATIRNSMRRTISRRRRTRAAVQKAARAEAEAQAQVLASRAVAEAATATAARTRSEQRMSVPPGMLRGDPNFRPPKMSMNGGYLRGPGDDEDSDDLDGSRQKRFFLSLDDDIVQAPSIGPRTAERLRANGIATVRDLLANKAAAISTRLSTRHITTEKIASWQHQARLVCTIPWLRGTHAQILVGSGYYAPHSLVTANRDALCTAILRFATTREGQSVLRSAPPPSLGKIMGWVEQAGMAEMDRAAVAILTPEKATAAA